MRAVRIHRWGGPEVLQVDEVATPAIGVRDLLIEVSAASINPRDWLIRSGRYVFRRMLPKLPFTLGSDVAGTVALVGAEVEEYSKGDAVFAMIPSTYGMGGYSELAAVPAKAVAPLPAGVSFAEAAAAPLAALTALQALRKGCGRLRSDQRVLVIGASGGVGHYGVQIARALGASDVVGVCSGRNVEFVQGLGASRVIDYRSSSFPPENPAALGIGRFEVVLDAIGMHSAKSCARLMGPRGRYVTTVPTGRVMVDAVRSCLFPFGHRSRIVLVRSDGEDLRQLGRWMEAGVLRSQLDRVESLDNVRALHEYSRTFRTRGKNVIAVREDACAILS